MRPPTRFGFILVLGLIAASAFAQQPVITPPWSIDQQQLENGQVPLQLLLQAGQRFFTTPYLPFNRITGSGDGYGEGPNGPRWSARVMFYSGTKHGWPFLRLNGLDSQSCYECHNTLGSYIVSAQNGGGFNRKPGTAGGSAGSNSNAFINPGFPNPLTYFVRNPPHTFGSAYTQTLADEMTWELLSQVSAARAKAQAAPNTWVAQVLSAKGLAFGSFQTRFIPTQGTGAFINCQDAVNCSPGGLTPYTPPAGFTDDMTNLTGVSCDFVVRPFQWKGVSSSIRHFARDALDFHFSMQAVEKYGSVDCDVDGKTNEMTLGNVSALASLVAMTRPPQQVFANDPAVVRGRSIFLGQVQGASGQMCATCHVASIPLYTPQLFVDNPGAATMDPSDCVADHPTLQGAQTHIFRGSLVSPSSAEDHPAFSRLGVDPKTGKPGTAFAAQTGLPCPRPQGPGGPPQPGYCIDLTNLPAGVPEHVLPRLPKTGSAINVPLFSDLRTHDMGSMLADWDLNGMPIAQPADVAGLCIQSRMFVTRPLWGVGDTGPWLHDGRALTLMDAIKMHGGEAQPIIDAFNALSPADQQAVVTFLLSLQLPCLPSISCPPVPIGQQTGP
ncbi:MAG: di-heme oxidoredictase family protein [Thermoanaerobaculia bacterium]